MASASLLERLGLRSLCYLSRPFVLIEISGEIRISEFYRASAEHKIYITSKLVPLRSPRRSSPFWFRDAMISKG